jgi:hypothetical protein
MNLDVAKLYKFRNLLLGALARYVDVFNVLDDQSSPALIEELIIWFDKLIRDLETDKERYYNQNKAISAIITAIIKQREDKI